MGIKKVTGNFIFMGHHYKVFMCDNVADVDGDKRKSLFGQVDLWDQEIRIYEKRNKEARRITLLHEALHLIEDFIRSETLNPTDADIDQMAHILYDTLERNKLIVADWSHIIPSEGVYIKGASCEGLVQ